MSRSVLLSRFHADLSALDASANRMGRALGSVFLSIEISDAVVGGAHHAGKVFDPGLVSRIRFLLAATAIVAAVALLSIVLL